MPPPIWLQKLPPNDPAVVLGSNLGYLTPLG
jgi:hypothetical protein